MRITFFEDKCNVAQTFTRSSARSEYVFSLRDDLHEALNNDDEEIIVSSELHKSVLEMAAAESEPVMGGVPSLVSCSTSSRRMS